MIKYLALLRGINVSKHHRISMQDLKNLATELGLSRVSTYLASGNLLFESNLAGKDIQRLLSDSIAIKFGYSVNILIKNHTQLTEIMNENPFAGQEFDTTRTLFASMLWEPLSQDAIKQVEALSTENERMIVKGSVIYTLLLRSYFSKSVMGRSFLSTKLRIQMTSRNWNTITKLTDQLAL